MTHDLPPLPALRSPLDPPRDLAAHAGVFEEPVQGDEMILKFRDPSVRLEVGGMADDAIASAIYNEIGVREMARRVGKSPTTISLFAAGKLALPLRVTLCIAKECGGLEESVWLATLYERMEAAERIGWTFRPEDRVKPEVFHA